MKYRPEIDGLRAVAVVPVILFHSGIAGFGGGFIGVDIFFALSGYLITSILLADLDDGRFSIATFYAKRARRILPALVFVSAVTVPFAWFWMLPSQLIEFGKSLVAVGLFISNILFWRESGYFDAAAELKPMLHTWSLAVEEQYYILFPVTLLVVWRMSRRLVLLALVMGLLGSLALAEWATRTAPSASFYLAPTRFWEILTGSVCAYLMIRYRVPRNEAAGILGLAIIVASFFLFDSATPTPSVWTLLPIVGTALVLIFGVTGSWTARILSAPALVGIGLISYSAYLWHQPVLALARIRLVDEIPAWLMTLLIPMIFVLAWGSWRYVEQPFRKTSPRPRWRVFAASGTALAATLAVGLVFVATKGMPTRPSPAGGTFAQLADVEAALTPNSGLDLSCDSSRPVQTDKCRTGPAPSVALWGDSYAMHLVQALSTSSTKADFVQLTLGSCAPFPGIAVSNRAGPAGRCIEFNDQALELILESDSIRTVIISSAYLLYEFPVFSRDGQSVPNNMISNAILESIRSTADILQRHGKQLVVISPPPRTGADIGRCYLRQHMHGADPTACDFSLSQLRPIDADINVALSRIGQGPMVIKLSDFICNDGRCHSLLGEVPLYRDKGHLTRLGSAEFGRRFDLMGQVLNKPAAALQRSHELRD